MSNPFDSEGKKDQTTKNAEESNQEFTTDQLFDMLISSMRKDVAKKLVKGAKGGYEKLMGDLDEDTFIEKNFTKIIEMRLNNAINNNK